MATIFDALKTKIGTLAAVTALTGTRIRPMKFAVKDDIATGPGLLIDPLTEDHQNDLSGIGGAVSLNLQFRCVSQEFTDAYAVAEALRTNGTTPGTGLPGFKGTVDGIEIQMVTLDSKKFDFIFYQDGSDEGYYVVDFVGTVDYTEAI